VQVRLLDQDKEMMGVMDTETALEMAQDEGLDLVMISPEANPPVCRLMDFKKFKFDQQKAEKEKQKKQKQLQVRAPAIQPRGHPALSVGRWNSGTLRRSNAG
jgi:translation initiation factor IF-3